MYTYIDVSATTKRKVIRPRTHERSGIVLHETAGKDSLSWLQGGSADVGDPRSSDFLIARTGEVYQITPPGWYSFHSGVARWRNYQEMDRSINQGFYGIELENNPELGEVLTSEQYIAAGWLCRRLMLAYGIDYRNLVGHSQVALPIGRKSDPATLNWRMLATEMLQPSHEQSLYVVRAEMP